jgi:hypothetical protein
MQCRGQGGGGGVREMADRQRTECNIASRRKDVSDRQLAERRQSIVDVADSWQTTERKRQQTE